jgi:hypothetical protein
VRCADTWARLAGATRAPVLAVVPRWGDDPTPVGIGWHRAFYAGWPSCDASRCGVAPGRCHAWTLTSLPLLALTWSFASTYRSGSPLKQLACTAIVLLLGMLGRPVVAGSGCSRYCAPGRGSRFASQPAGRACPLPSAPDRVRRWSIPPRRWREGQVDDGWNREVVQRREGLRLHRP